MDDATTTVNAGENGATASKEPRGPRLRFNTAQLKSTYCNVCNATSTREEVVINFGVNQNWDQSPDLVEIDLHHRVIVSPFAAKRLHEMLGQLLQQYEERYGPLRG
jgi:hypothetical protein